MAEPDGFRQLVLAIHERHANAILSGSKTHELRRRLRSVAAGDRVYLYATAPASAVVGSFVVRSVSRMSPDGMWAAIGVGFAITETEFHAYTEGADEVTALEVAEPRRLKRPADAVELTRLAPEFSPPQSVSVLRSATVQSHLERLCLR